MQLYKKSIFYKIAYGLREDRYVPSQTTLCEFVWDMGLGSMAWVFVFVVLVVMSVFAFILLGFRVDLSAVPGVDPLFVSIKHWPKVRGMHLMPVVPAAIVGVCFGLFKGFQMIIALMHSAVYFWGAISLIAVIALMVWKRNFLLECFLAFKEKACPMIRFIE